MARKIGLSVLVLLVVLCVGLSLMIIAGAVVIGLENNAVPGEGFLKPAGSIFCLAGGSSAANRFGWSGCYGIGTVWR